MEYFTTDDEINALVLEFEAKYKKPSTQWSALEISRFVEEKKRRREKKQNDDQGAHK